MHSKPIDLLVRAPEQPKTQPSDSEPDGRFSELLRRPSDAVEKPAATDPKDPSTDMAGTPGQDRPPADAAIQAGPDSAPLQREKGKADAAFIEALAIIPEAITRLTPAPAAPDADPSAEAVAPIPQVAPASPAAPPALAVPAPAAAAPAVATPAADAASAAAPILAAPGRQEAGSIGGQTERSAIVTNSGNGAHPPMPTATVPAAPVPPSNPAVAIAEPRTAGVEPAKPAGVYSGTGSEAVPVVTAGNTATAAPVDAAPADGIIPSLQAAAIAPKAPAAPTRPTNVAGERPFAPDASEPVDVPELVDPAEPAVANTAAKAGVTAKPTPGSAGNAAIPVGERSTTMTAQPSARPDAATADMPAPTVQSETPATAATTATARPAVETAVLAQTGGNATPPPPASEQVVLQLRRAVAEGVDRLTVQLKPASLGRVDVQMEVGHDGRLQALISAERPETLHLLQRDARALTTALNDAGLQADSGSLSFNLRGQTGDQAGGSDRPANAGMPDSDSIGADYGDDPTAPITLTLGAGRVDIKV